MEPTRTRTPRPKGRGHFFGSVFRDVIGALIAAAILGAAGWGWSQWNEGAEQTAESAPTTSSPTVTETTSGSDPGLSPKPCDRLVSAGGGWVQVESHQSEPEEFLVPTVIEADDGDFCDGSGLVTPEFARLMLDAPLTAGEVDDLENAAPSGALRRVCEVRRQMRIAGSDFAAGSAEAATLFSDFVLIPSNDWIGPNRCYSSLASDADFGSRAAIDRYFGVIDAHQRGGFTAAEATTRLERITTSAFLDESNGAANVLRAWADCTQLDVRWMGAPEPTVGLDSVDLRVECRESDGAVRTRKFVLAMAPPIEGDPIWRVHWDLEHWGNAPPLA